MVWSEHSPPPDHRDNMRLFAHIVFPEGYCFHIPENQRRLDDVPIVIFPPGQSLPCLVDYHHKHSDGYTVYNVVVYWHGIRIIFSVSSEKADIVRDVYL